MSSSEPKRVGKRSNDALVILISSNVTSEVFGAKDQKCLDSRDPSFQRVPKHQSKITH
jgi:hypothetical protein